MTVTSPGTTAPARAHPTAILVIILVSYFMILLDNSIVFTGLPTIGAAMRFSATGLSWVQDAYTLVFGGLLLLGARLGDLLGRRRVFIAGLAVFALASFLVGAAPTGSWLIAARALQGVGAAIVAPSSLSLLTASFEGRERTQAVAWYGAAAGIGASLGLVIGGALTSTVSWRAGFFINVPIGLAMIVLAPRFLPASARASGRFDAVGAISATLGMGALVFGIVNGSTNFILDSMDRQGLSAEEAQRIATELGYLEADPTLDLGGYDAAQKAAIIASLAFHTQVALEDVHREGIEHITAGMIEGARRAGYTIKLLAVAERLEGEDGESISVRVYPALISREHPLASVHGGNNAVYVSAAAAGDLMFYGAGAGGLQTASAVLGDVVSAARRHIAGGVGVGESPRQSLPTAPIGRILTRYQVTLEVADAPGVLATIASIVSEAGVSVATIEQTPSADAEGRAHIVIGTHRALEQDLSDTVDRLASSDVVERVVSVLRVEGE